MFVWNKFCCYLLRFSLFGFLGVSFRGQYGNCALVASSLVEVNDAIRKSIQCIVLALSNILSREVSVTTLANDNVAGNNLLTTPNLNT